MGSIEKKRLDNRIWQKWGPYVSERAWGTVREDYSADGDAWRYLSHDHARSYAYRWSEDGIAGICDQFQNLVFSLAFWNEKDPILKERLFGLNPYEGNHGEDVKEYYFYLDSTPTHSYMKYLYKYPQQAFPYEKLVEENQKRGTRDREFELLDTGVFAQNAYFDVVVEYAKAAPEDILIRVEVFNRGKEKAPFHFLPHLFFRNQWSWTDKPRARPTIIRIEEGVLYADSTNLPPVKNIPFSYPLSSFYLYAQGDPETLFTENETNCERLYQTPSPTPYVKDAFHGHVIHQKKCINPDQKGSKAAFHFAVQICPETSHLFYLRLSSEKNKKPFGDFEKIFAKRKKEADAFYEEIHPSSLTPEEKKIQRTALSGMLWSKQFYHYDVSTWLKGDPLYPSPPLGRDVIRNKQWKHIHANTVISMPDKWEYPWFAAWDLAFHTLAYSLVDLQFAKEQLYLLLTYHYQHPNGQIPAYEWEFSDLNPPVQAWAAWKLYQKDQDLPFLEKVFVKLLVNFTWWVNKVDKQGNNFFEGGFLGLDNISIIDRSKPLPNGGTFEESDGSGWMGFFSLLMLRMALELSRKGSLHFQELAALFLQHFILIAQALQINKGRQISLWDENEGFFYDVITDSKGNQHRLKVRSFVGIIPFYSFEFFEEEELKQFPHFYNRLQVILKENASLCAYSIEKIDVKGKVHYLFSLITQNQRKKMFQKLWDPDEFFSPYGLRSLSKIHAAHPVECGGNTVGYEPGESYERIKGGNSNWRGPVWFPTNYLVLETLHRWQLALNDAPLVQTKQGTLKLSQLKELLRSRLIDLFRRNNEGKVPVHGDDTLFQTDPYWKELLLFYEHYHGDTGRGLGASHQTGWSGLVAVLFNEPLA